MNLGSEFVEDATPIVKRYWVIVVSELAKPASSQLATPSYQHQTGCVDSEIRWWKINKCPLSVDNHDATVNSGLSRQTGIHRQSTEDTRQLTKKNPKKRTVPATTTNKASTYNIVLFQGGRESLTRRTLATVMDQLDECVDTLPNETEIDVWIDSPGGDAHAAFKLYLDLRSRASLIRVLVPDFAKSAATLFAIGADELYMSNSADLGPLDVQVEHPDREGMTVSSLSCANSLEHLTTLAMDLVMAHGPQLIRWTGLPRAEILRETLEFATHMMNPVVSKLDPQLIHEASEALKVTMNYAQIVLSSRRNNKLTKRKIQQISHFFVTNYPTHGYVIDRTQLSDLGIETYGIDTHPLWPKIQNNYYIPFMGGSDESIIKVVREDELEEQDHEHD